ncbi:aminotransferase class I/II-fold pyridoxal phosphate-dependent enzyme [Terrilactibacillus laevilacticus]|uniref:Aminotransferase class I/II-fold pyridoxal phosphate-dependent enzyme n=1 Tax=Terrilactibacillus laevilacticus TaxID=1380157 RepID=A0ABW5PNF2_9BACI|nr:aminotransferase class I/II-fold pyridoxal phosphate-dependent enzyme [Terrilactibacillus laevilacticus]
MTDFNTLSVVELNELKAKLQEKYEEYKSKKLSLNMARGKPCPEQLDLSMGMLDTIRSDSSLISKEGIDCRNYGGIDGLVEAKELLAPLLEVSTDEIIIGGNSSLNMMHDTIFRAMFKGVLGGEQPWGQYPKIKFLCPSPGYDRHFSLCEFFDIEMVVVDMLEDGPDMEQVEKLVSEDETIKGIWCVPKYSNPEGVTYSDEVVDRLAKMETKAKDFRIFWDNAYAVHHLTDKPDQLKNILHACQEAGHPNRPFLFGSTSKISFPGSGVAVMGSSKENIQYIKKQLSAQTIGPDKINQLRHVLFFKDFEGLQDHMKKQADIIKPKFDKVLELFDSELEGKHIATWSKPNGGYFISLNTLDGTAKDIVELAAEAGVTLTGAGATFPYRKDPKDRNIRIAPTFPSLEELELAIQVLCVCIQLISVEKILASK